ncbi:hypothetical protein [Picosynechococcus sp. PCC 7117]|uniref:hypothetical protein n=1 Tax=Picosynechococcus sp. PCC 7117 TaxID=195498 RepID=UPI0018DCC713|nr:hypothetical protein [Picosynechococcus sp. PCC 7117]
MSISKADDLSEIDQGAIALCWWLPSQAMRLYNKGYVGNHCSASPNGHQGLPLIFPQFFSCSSPKTLASSFHGSINYLLSTPF